MPSRKMHRLLKRQLKRSFGESFEVPREWSSFIDMVNSAYHESDSDRNMLERSLELSSQELLQANSEMRAIFEAVPDIFFRIDASGTILDCKTGNTSDLLVSRRDLIGNKIYDIPLTRVASKFKKSIEDIRKNSAPVSLEYSLLLNQIENFYEARLIPVLEDQIIVIIRNITDTREAESALHKSEEIYTRLVNAIPDIVVLADLHGKINFVNDYTLRIGGYSRDEMEGCNLLAFVSPKDHEHVVRNMFLMLEQRLGPEEFHLITKDGREITFEVNGDVLRNEDGTPFGMVEVCRDITERRKAEETLRENEKRFRLITDNVQDTVWIMDMNLQTTWISPSVEQTRGFTMEELLSLPLERHLTPQSLRIGLGLIEENFSQDRLAKPQEDISIETEMEFYRKDGSTMWADTVITLLRDGQGTPTGYLGVSRDTTQRRKMEEAIRESEERFKSIVSTSQDWIWAINTAGIHTFSNPAVAKILGYHPDDIVGRPLDPSFIHEEDMPMIRELLELSVRQKKGWENIIYRCQHRDGTYRYLESNAVPILDSTGVLKGFQGTDRDITDRRRAEEVLRESEAKLQAIFNQIDTGIMIIDSSTQTIVEANRKAVEMTGLPREKIIGQICHCLVCPAEIGRCPVKDLGQIVDQSERFLLHADGSQKNILKTVNPITIKGQEYYLESFIDISDRKQAEEALRESENKYRLLTERITDIVWITDRNLRELYVSPSVQKVLGFTPEERVLQTIDQKITAATLPLAIEAMARELALEEQGNCDPDRNINIVLEYYHQDGSTRWMETIINLIRDDQGIITEVYGVSRDITGRKHAEEELHESQKRLENIIEFLPDATLVIDQEGKVIAWNRSMEAMTGVRKEDMLGKGDYEYGLPFYGERRPILIDYALRADPEMEKRYQGVQRVDNILFGEALTPNIPPGNVHLSGTASVLQDSKGKVIAAIECIRDVTHIKETDFKLNLELSKFRALYDLAVNLSTERTLEENLIFIVEKSRELLGTDTAFIALADPDQPYLYMHTLSGIETSDFKKIRFTSDQGLGGLIMKNREGYIIDDYFNDKNIMPVSKDIIRKEGLISSMAVPVHAGDRNLGILYVANRRATRFTQNNLDTLLLFGNLAAVEIVRKQVESDLRKSETKYRTVFENTGSAMVIIENDTIISLANEEFSRMTGHPKHDIEGKKSWTEFVVPEDLSKMMEQHIKRRQSKKDAVNHYEFRLLDQTGNLKNIYLKIDMIPGTSKSVASLIDITENKRAEAALQAAHDELEHRVAERTYELTAANTNLKELFQKQDVNIDLAKNILAMINYRPGRHNFIQNGVDLFLTAYYLPCYAEGGDHYFVKNLSERYPGIHKTAISLKDQSGHEVSCILRSIITDLIHNTLLINTPDSSLEATITQLNREICELPFFGEDNFFTAINAEINHENLIMHYVSAGHPPFVLIRGRDIICLPSIDSEGRNLPIGVHQAVDFLSGEIQLQTGDKLIFFTDGLTDIPHKSGKPVLNAEDMKTIIASIIRDDPRLPVSILLARLFNRIIGQTGDSPVISRNFEDDITLLGLELEDGNDEVEDIVRPENLDDFDRCVNKLFHKISAEWEQKGFPSPESRLRMVLEEAMVNAWSHGNHEDPQKTITVRRRYGNDAVLEVIDEGGGFDFKTFYDPTSKENLLKPRGRGNFIMRLLTEETQWRDGGRHLIAYFSREDKAKHASRSFPGLNLWRRLKKD